MYHFDVILEDLTGVVPLERFIFSREASKLGIYFEFPKWHFSGIQLLSIFSETNRYSAKLIMQ